MANGNTTALGFLGGLMLGVTAGLLVGLLMAPASGEETRRRWRRRLEDEADDLRRKGRRALEDASERIGEKVEGSQRVVRKALRR
jgi:gas vesicle protein